MRPDAPEFPEVPDFPDSPDAPEADHLLGAGDVVLGVHVEC